MKHKEKPCYLKKYIQLLPSHLGLAYVLYDVTKVNICLFRL